MTKKTILVLASSFPRWDGDSKSSFVYELSKRLALNSNVIILAPHDKNCMSQEKIGNCIVHRFKYAPEKYEVLAYRGGILSNLKKNKVAYLLVPFFFIAQIYAIIKLTRQYQIDLIHAHWIIPQGISAWLASYFYTGKPRLLLTSHGGDIFALEKGFFRWLKQKVINKADHITVVSQAMKEYLLANYNGHHCAIDVISMGVDLTDTFVPDNSIHRNKNQIIFVGRLVEKKGVSTLLNAIHQLKDRIADITLTIIGSGPDEQKLLKQAHELNISSHISFTGHLPPEEIIKYYQSASIAVFPFKIADNGDQEGLGLVVIEAMGCGCPVIAGDVPAVHDTVINNQTGLLVSPEQPHAYAEKIYLLLKEPSLQEKLSLNARALVAKKYDWKIIHQKYAKVIQDMV